MNNKTIPPIKIIGLLLTALLLFSFNINNAFSAGILAPKTPTPTRTSTPTRTLTATNTFTASPTNTFTNTPTNTPTSTFTNTPTDTVTNTSTWTPTSTATATATINGLTVTGLSQSNGGDGILLGVNGGSSPSIGGAETDIYAWYHFDLQTDPNWNPGQKYTYLNLTVKNNTSTIKTIYASWELTSSLPVGKQQGFVQFPNYPIVWNDLPYTGNGVQITIINPGQSWTFTTKIDAKADAGRNVPYTNDHRLHLAVYAGSSGVSTPTPSPTITPTATFTPTSTPANTPTSWYTGNSRLNAWGIRAKISAPAQAPYLAGSGESNWVSLPKLSEQQPWWMQTGWRYYQGYSAPDMYVEVSTPAGYEVPYIYGTHFWGWTVEYEIHLSSGNIWCAKIDGDLMRCDDIGRTAPSDVYASSEVHFYPQNALDTFFSEVYYMDSSEIWHLFDQARWREDAPYHVDRTQYYEFHNYGP